jgi:hypothetical protein
MAVRLRKGACSFRIRSAGSRGADAIGLAVGKVIGKYKMAKHFDVTITDTSLAAERRQDRIDAEVALDGIYVIRMEMNRFLPPPTWSPGPGFAPRPTSPVPAPGPGRRAGGDTWMRGSSGGPRSARPVRHLPRRAVFPDRPPPRQGPRPGCRRSLHPVIIWHLIADAAAGTPTRVQFTAPS